MRFTFGLALALASMLAGGCVVPSLQPLIPPGGSIAEPRLVGVWASAQDSTVYKISSDESGRYRVAATDSDGQLAEYELSCCTISGHTVIDLFPTGRGGYHAWDFLPLHSAFIVNFTDTGMQLDALRPGWLDAHRSGQASASVPLRLAWDLDSSVPILSGPSEEIMALYCEQIENPEAFHRVADLERLPDMDQMKEISKTMVSAQMAFYAKNGTYSDSLAALAAPPTFIDARLASGSPLPGVKVDITRADENGFEVFVTDASGRGFRTDQTGVVEDLLEVAAHSCARTLLSGQFAFYATNGRYSSSLVELAAQRFISDELGSGVLSNGIRVEITSASLDGFVAKVLMPEGGGFRGDQTGQIRPLEKETE